MRKEYDLEKTLPSNIKDFINLIDFDEDLNNSVNIAFEGYKKNVSKLTKINKSLEIKQAFYIHNEINSVTTSFEIEDESINENNSAEDVVKKLYKDKDFCKYFNTNLIKNMKSVNKVMINDKSVNPGKFRSELKRHCVIQRPNDVILPISHENTKKYIEVLNQFNTMNINYNDRFVNSWVIHCFFESIHPFSDGNGRVGRFLLNNNINIFDECEIFFDETLLIFKGEYYHNIHLLDCNISYYDSINWFLNIVLKTIKSYNQKIDDIINIYSKLKESVFINYKKYKDVLSMLFACNYDNSVSYLDLRENLTMIKTKKTLDRLIDRLIDDGIIKEYKQKGFKLESIYLP